MRRVHPIETESYRILRGMVDVDHWLTLDPWQSVQYIVCVPTALRHGRRQLLALNPPRAAVVRPVLSITGCHERWLLVA